MYVGGKPALVTLDYIIDTSVINSKNNKISSDNISKFTLSYYPHKLEVFKNMLKRAFSSDSKFRLYGDFKSLDEIVDPAFYIHVVEKI